MELVLVVSRVGFGLSMNSASNCIPNMAAFSALIATALSSLAAVALVIASAVVAYSGIDAIVLALFHQIDGVSLWLPK